MTVAIAKLQKWGNSQGLRRPKHMLDTIGWHDNDCLGIQEHEGTLIIKRTPEKIQRKSIKELFANFDSAYEPIEIDWGKPTGKEIW